MEINKINSYNKLVDKAKRARKYKNKVHCNQC